MTPPPRDEEPVRACRREALEPVAPFINACGLSGEGGIRAHDRIVQDVHNRGQIALSGGPDHDSLRVGG
jgi:hypothetical protein